MIILRILKTTSKLGYIPTDRLKEKFSGNPHVSCETPWFPVKIVPHILCWSDKNRQEQCDDRSRWGSAEHDGSKGPAGGRLEEKGTPLRTPHHPKLSHFSLKPMVLGIPHFKKSPYDLCMIYICIYIYVCIYVYICIYIYMCIYLYVYIMIYIYTVYIYVS